MTTLKDIHPELNIDNFSHLDGTIIFFSFVRAAMKRVGAKKILNFGAGRGADFELFNKETGSLLKHELIDLRSDGAELWACDVDPVVLNHSASHHQVVIQPDKPLPFDDCSFDIVFSDYVFEHIQDAEFVRDELLRVLKPGGYICARTVNKYCYVALGARLVPNRKHADALETIMPDREREDVFPTAYRMNSVKDIKSLFSGCEVYWYRDSASPSYYFGNMFIYRLMLGLHKILPNSLDTSLCLFIRKPA